MVLCVEKLIFRSAKNAQDRSLYSDNLAEKYIVHDQHVSFYRFVKITNRTKTKIFSDNRKGFQTQNAEL
jgi:hypothetical protein